jgi:elongation factor P
MKNVITGATIERSFNPTDKFPTAHIDKRDMQYLYKDEDVYNFMDLETYEQIPITTETVGDALKFVKENEICKILSFKGNVFGIEPPIFVELEVIDAEPGVKGDTATGATKPATVETGAQVNVPLFINRGDRIRIDTRTESYMERA